MRFSTLVFTTNQCFVCRIFCMQRDFINPSLFTLAFLFCQKCMYADHTHTICTHTLMNYMQMLSLRLRIVDVCSAYAYKKTHHNHMDHMCMLSIGLQIVYVSLVLVYKLYAYAQSMCTICTHMLSLCICTETP